MPRASSCLTLLASFAVAVAIGTASCGSERREADAEARPREPDPTFTRAAAIERHFQGRELGPIEGIWLEAGGAYEIAIVPNQTGWRQDWPYAGMVINANDSGWKRGMPQLYFRPQPLGAGVDTWIGGETVVLIQQGANVLDGTIPNPFGTPKRLRLLRAYPEVAQTPPSLRTQPGPDSERRRGESSGTGFFVAGDVIATNDHVIRGAKKISFVHGTEKLEAEPVRFDGRMDIALVRLKSKPGRPVVCLSLGRTAEVVSGEKAYVLGHPSSFVLSSDTKVTEGIVSAPRGPDNDSTRLQHSVPTQPGNSGSPLIDEFGYVIGVVDSRMERAPDGRRAENVNFAVKVRFLREMLATWPAEKCESLAGPSPTKLDAREIFSRYSRSVVRLEIER